MNTINDIYYNLRSTFEKIPRAIILIVLLSIIILIPFPETITGKVTLVNLENQEVCAMGRLPYYYRTELKEGIFVQIELEGFKSKKDGSQCGFITYINTEIENTPKGKCFSYTALLNSNPFLCKGMEGKIYIALPNKCLLMRLLNLFDNK